MPTNRLVFFLFVLVLVAALVYLNVGNKERGTETVTLSPKAYIERVEAGKAKPAETPADAQSQ